MISTVNSFINPFLADSVLNTVALYQQWAVDIHTIRGMYVRLAPQDCHPRPSERQAPTPPPGHLGSCVWTREGRGAVGVGSS